ncbi:radical SAM protein [Adlercreutzia murintestinalis]|uniref:radical SAM protein n=1 Tax=Adlercreutzia murintestinalis TaxID=2941325 RepID=UPI00203F4D64|nr:radical SAM protein [Adlercreutzia murintestinalis]
MHFASGIVRPPFEAGCEFLQVTSGCSHNSCRFCTFYKDARFAVSDLEEVKGDIDELSKSPWHHYNRIWLQGADAFALPYDRLMKIAEAIYEKLPWVKSIGAFARATNFRNKSTRELEMLADAGYSRLTVGIETGDDELLAWMNKGYDADFALEQMEKVNDAGLTWVGQFLNGLGGYGYGDESAIATAEFYNKVPPMLIYTASLTLFKDTPLYGEVLSDTFREATEIERLEELKVLIDRLGCETEIRCEHVSMPVKLAGRLPEDKERLISILDRGIVANADGELERYRKSIVGL